MKEATCILYNGTILTLDQWNTVVPAVAFCGERILATGTNAEMLRLAGPHCRTIDLAGAVVTPGFFDAHGHFFQYAEFKANFVDLNTPPIGQCVHIADCLDRLRERAAQVAKGGWVLGYGFDDTMIAEKRFPTSVELDEVSTDHHVALVHISIRFAAVNSLVLAKLQYSRATVDPPAGVIWRGADNEPDGVLEGTAVNHLFTHFPAVPSERYADAMVELAHEYASKGITTAIEAGCGQPRYFHAFLQAEAQGRMFLRLAYNPSAMFVGEKGMENYSSRLLARHGPKLWYDGSLQGFTGYLSTPYHTPYKGNPDWCGYPGISRDRLVEIITGWHEAGLQCVAHANGDQAIEDILDAFEHVLERMPRVDHRFLLIHAQTIRDDQLDRCRQLGVTISFFTPHVYYWGDRHYSLFLGPERTLRQNPMRSALNRGIPVTSHCDAPIVPVSPALSMWACVNRVSSSGQVLGAQERITPLEALRAHTTTPAWQNFEDHDKGTIEAGKYADVIVLDRDPLACDPMELRNITVKTTFIGGEIVFQKA